MIISVLVVGLLFNINPLIMNGKEAISPLNKDILLYKNTSNGNTLYVGGTGPGNYSTIQAAIDAASDGDTIFIYNGVYSGFTANKQLTILGESRNNTIVCENYNALFANGITLSRLSLKGKTFSVDCILEIKANEVLVSDCGIYPPDGLRTEYGLYIEYCSNVTISNCEITGFVYEGIQLRYAVHCNIENCIISSCGRGIYSMWDDEYNCIYNCEIFDCGWNGNVPCGVQLDDSNNYICNCNIHDNVKGLDIYCSKYNQVTGCNIHNNQYGCVIEGLYDLFTVYAEQNYIMGNNISENQIGLDLEQYALYNNIHHNNFLLNSQYNAKDNGDNNQWDNGSIGNYWDDYDGSDNNGDGIGDTPYYVSPNGVDHFPLMNAFNPGPLPPEKPILNGSISLIQWVEYTYEALSFDPNYDIVSYLFDWGDGTNSSWVGPFGYGINGTASHYWQNYGTFDVNVKSKDVHGQMSDWSDILQVTVSPNNRPEKPLLFGPSEGIVGYSINYSLCSTDNDSDQLRYWINWGDSSEWTDYYNSGETVYVSHSWGANYPPSGHIPDEKIFKLQVKAQDVHGADSMCTSMLVTIKNHAPGPPNINGETQIKIRKSYQITASSIDPDGHKVCFEVKWGDKDETFTNVFVSSGKNETIKKDVPYYNPGNYTIEVRAVDYYWAKGNWSSMPITAPLSEQQSISKINLVVNPSSQSNPQIKPLPNQQKIGQQLNQLLQKLLLHQQTASR